MQADVAAQLEAGGVDEHSEFIERRKILKALEGTQTQAACGADDALPCAIGAGEHERATRFEDAAHFADGLVGRGRMFDHFARHDNIKRLVTIRELESIANDGSDGSFAQRFAQQFDADIEAGNVCAATVRGLRKPSAAAACIEERFAGEILWEQLAVDDFEPAPDVVIVHQAIEIRSDGGVELVGRTHEEGGPTMRRIT
jgi:hypothetical protein